MPEFIVPLPPPECSPNYHGHWRHRHKATKQYREVARLTWLGTVKGWKACKVGVSAVYYCGPTLPGVRVWRPLDIGNAQGGLKAVIDGFVDAGMCPTDSYKWVTWGEVEIRRTQKDHQGKAYVALTITRAD